MANKMDVCEQKKGARGRASPRDDEFQLPSTMLLGESVHNAITG